MKFLTNLELSLCVKFVGFFVFCSDLVRLSGSPKDDYEKAFIFILEILFLYVEGKVKFPPCLTKHNDRKMYGGAEM
jgi:hypothetical protein